MGDDRILICFDVSNEARNAINAAASLLKPRRGIVPDRVGAAGGGELRGFLGDVVDDSFGDLIADDALRRSRAGVELAEEAKFIAQARDSLASSTWAGIVANASELDARAIVIGSRGLAGARARLEGNVSHAIAEHEGRPVLIVPSQWPDGNRGRERS
jgi:nucleotide-binding universal stress UspA family protein